MNQAILAGNSSQNSVSHFPTVQRLHPSNSSHGQLNLIVPNKKRFKKRNKSVRPSRTLKPPEQGHVLTRDQNGNSILIFEEGR